MKISNELRQYIKQNEHIKKVYFDRYGDHYFNVHESEGKFYSRQSQPFEEQRANYAIVEILTREQILEQELEEIGDSIQRKSELILAFNILVNNTNFNFMAVVKSLNLTSAAPVQLSMTVIDQNGNPIAGVLTGLSYAVADPTQDVAVVDSANPLDVDIHAVSNTGGTTVIPSGNFVSTLLQADGKTPVFSGPVTGPALTLTNNIPVQTLTPSLAFNQ